MRFSVSSFCLTLLACTSHSVDSSNNNSVSTTPNNPNNSNQVSISPKAPTLYFGTKPTTAPESCGQNSTKLCNVGENCKTHIDCTTNACNESGICVENLTCIPYYGGMTCGQGEVEDLNAKHESCCKALSVAGYQDSSHPGKTIYLEKYEITAGRMRAFVNSVIQEMGKPDFKSWVKLHRPEYWNDSWTQFLPSDYEGDTITINRMFLGDPRHLGQTQEQAGPGVVLVPATDQTVSTGLNHQFNGQVYLDTHGNNCGTYNGSYGFPTYYYPPNVLVANGELPRVNPTGYNNQSLDAQKILDSKSMNCATGLMFQLFCSSQGGQLATSEIMDYVTNSPSDRSLAISGCGSQYDNHGDLLSNILSTSLFTGGKCVDAYAELTNITFDAGDALPVAGSLLNIHPYHYPDLGSSTSDKSWTIAAPGRMPLDIISSSDQDGWMDLAGNLTETTLETSSGVLDGLFALRFRGVGEGTERSDLNTTLMPGETILRVQRPESKSALVGARCIYYR